MTCSAKQKLLYIGEILGTDAYYAIKAWSLFEDIEALATEGDERAIKVIEALNLVHDAIKKATELR